MILRPPRVTSSVPGQPGFWVRLCSECHSIWSFLFNPENKLRRACKILCIVMNSKFQSGFIEHEKNIVCMARFPFYWFLLKIKGVNLQCSWLQADLFNSKERKPLKIRSIEIKVLLRSLRLSLGWVSKNTTKSAVLLKTRLASLTTVQVDVSNDSPCVYNRMIINQIDTGYKTMPRWGMQSGILHLSGNPSTWEAKQEACHQFKDILGCIVRVCIGACSYMSVFMYLCVCVRGHT